MNLKGLKKKAAMTTLAGLAVLGMVTVGNATPAVAAGQRHAICVQADQDAEYRFSVYADLYTGDGTKVYHWQATQRKQGSTIHWNFTDGNDGGWVNLWIDAAPGKRSAFLHQSLKHDIAYRINGGFHPNGDPYIVQWEAC